jgi:hypothetical protein
LSGLSDALWACGDVDACFKGSTKVVVPWPTAGRRKGESPSPLDGVAQLVARPARLHEVDPRALYASQPWVVREHVAYYLTGDWEKTGRTSADMHSAANRFPTLADRRGQLVIVTGHHRSLAALIQGRPVLARVARAAEVPPVAITPHISVSKDRAGVIEDVETLIERLQVGSRISVRSVAGMEAILRRLGLDDTEIDDRLRRAGIVNRSS